MQDKEAPWLDTIWTAAKWFKSSWCSHPLFQLVHRGVSILTVYPDLMHCKHLGVDMYFFGTILTILVYDILPGSPNWNIIELFGKIKKYYKEHKIKNRFAGLCLSMIGNVRHPWTKPQMLKGKAAEIKDFGGALLELWRTYMHTTGPSETTHRKILLALELNCKIEKIVSDHASDWRFEGTTGEDFRSTVFNFLMIFNALGSEYSPSNRTDGKCGFNVTTKAHYLAHCALYALYLNPRLGWCYSGEDMMHHFRDLLQTCTRGNNCWTSVFKFSEKYCVALGLDMMPEGAFILQR